jgi:ABC-type phosphate transport system substrate-binding protein
LRRNGKIALAIAVCALVPLSALAQDPGYKVIVREDHPGTAIRRDQLAAIYLGQARSWAEGNRIRPVDQSTQSEIRNVFSREALGRSIEAVKTYWKRQILLGGLRPPPVKENDLDVIEYVSSKKGSIGYVTPSARLPASVKELDILE